MNNLWWIAVTLAAALLVAHTFGVAGVRVDTTSLLLLGIMLISPLVPAFRRLRLGEFEADIGPEEVERVRQRVEEQLTAEGRPPLGLPEIEGAAASIRSIATTDHILALAKLRIELEKVLTKIDRATAPPDRGPMNRPRSLGWVIRELVARQALPKATISTVQDVIAICNRAVHGDDIAREDAESLITAGVSLLVDLFWHAKDLAIEPEKTEDISDAESQEYQLARYRVTSVVPYVEHPRRLTRIMTQEQLDEYLDGYDEYAEFIVGVEKL